MPMKLSLTGVYAALIALLAIFLATRVVTLRRRLSVGLGSGGENSLERAIRAHGNLVEYAPLALLLMLVLETSGVRSFMLHGLGITLLAGRLLHAWGLSGRGGVSFGRFYGTALTWLTIIVASALLLVGPFIR